MRAGAGVAGVVLLLLVAALSAQPRPEVKGSSLPEGAGVQVLRARCLSCHASDLIESQRLTRDGWAREIDKMIRWGASVPDADRAPLLSYLAAQFPAAAPAASHAGAAGGEAIFKRACLACHGADLTEQQRLSPTGWTREVEKMMRWGASVTEAEKAVLVDYLSATYPIR